MKKIISIFALIQIAISLSAFTSGKKVSGAELERKAESILKQMTLEEKAMMLVGLWEEDAPSNIISSAGRTHPLERFGLLPVVLNDGATGLRIDTVRVGYPDKFYYCTGFPVAIMLASTWNDEIVGKVGETIAGEMDAYGTDMLLGPSLNIQRNPLCGRNFEYFSEDPYLAGHTAAVMVRSVQKEGFGACIKHFAANSQQSARVNNNAIVSQRALRELYLRNFEIAVKEGHPQAVMSSLNLINGTRTCASTPLLTGVLRDEWGWNGVVMTDWFEPEVTADCVHAGNDLLMGGLEKQVKDIIRDVQNGTLAIADVDRNVKNVLKLALNSKTNNGHVASFEPDLEGDAKVSLEAAREGIVLLKNEGGALPLKASDTVGVFGVGSYYFHANGLGSADINKPYTVNLLDGMKQVGLATNITLDEFYAKYFRAQDVQLREENTKTWKHWFFGYKKAEEADLRDFFVERRAKECSAAVVTIARNCGEALDRDYVKGEYLLSDAEQLMIDRVCTAFHAEGKKVIVVVNTGGPIEIASWNSKPDAIVLAWQPGQEGGRAVADVLTGAVNPSGKLPVTWSADYFDNPSAKNFPIHYEFAWDDVKTEPSAKLEETKKTRNLGYTEYEEDIWVGYRYFSTFNKPVAYPFGYGLSYTDFAWSDAKVEKVSARTAAVSITVTNTGAVSGKDVVELYSTAPAIPGFEVPVRELRAYAKTPILNPGESARVTLEVALQDLASFHEDSMSWITPKGVHTLSFGASCDDIRSTVQLTVPKDIIRKVANKI